MFFQRTFSNWNCSSSLHSVSCRIGPKGMMFYTPLASMPLPPAVPMCPFASDNDGGRVCWSVLFPPPLPLSILSRSLSSAGNGILGLVALTPPYMLAHLTAHQHTTTFLFLDIFCSHSGFCGVAVPQAMVES